MSPLKILIIDNYDSFTYNLYDYLLQLKTDCTVIRNDEIPFEKIHELSFDAIVLSPGPKQPKDAGFMMELIDYYHHKVPILGICLGHQGIGEYFGANLQKANQPMHGKTSVIQHQGHPLFKSIPSEYTVMRYHSLLINQYEGTDLKSIAHTRENENMAIAHSDLPIHGVQFHPESILTEHGLQLLQNWLRLVHMHLVTLRAMKPAEAALVSDLIIRSHNAINQDDVTEEGQTHLIKDIFAKEALIKRQANGNYIVVAVYKDTIVGMAEFRTPGHIKLLFINPQTQGLGLGKKLLQESITWTKKNNPDRSFITVNSAPKALGFYLKFGFVQTEDLRRQNGIAFLPMKYDL